MFAWDNIPEGLKWCRQWLLAGPNEIGELKVPHTISARGPYRASNTDSSQWMDYETACEAASALGWAIGFVLTEKDPYTCIDLDVKNSFNSPNHPEKWTTQEQADRFWKLTQAFDSYTERSGSKQGLHIWLRGNIGPGCRHDNVEVYSQERFIVCTGDLVFNKPIEDREELLQELVDGIRARQSANHQSVALVEVEAELTDQQIIDRAANASNGDKFKQLWMCTCTDPQTGELGSFVNLGYPSQSHADLALMSMFTFYSKSNEQCKRLFRMTGLGQRSKATKNDRYLNETLTRIRSRQAGEDKFDDNARQLAMALVQQLQNEAIARCSAPNPQGVPTPLTTPDGAAVAAVHPTASESIAWPPGTVGQLAWYIYQSSPRPVKEVAIVSALGLLAGICGKTYVISNSGLNLYIILIGRSAIGKEAMHTGIANILYHVRNATPMIDHFVDFSDFVSGPALTKACVVKPSFVNVAGEWGKKLQRLSKEDGRDAAMQSLRTVMTNLYQKSGPTSIVGGLQYSNKENNISSIAGVAYSMIGESTPNTFYEALTPNMMEDGFLSRFTVIEYTGDRPDENKYPVFAMDPALVANLAMLTSHTANQMTTFGKVYVQIEPTAQGMLDAFGTECDLEIKSTKDESWRQMWNRGHLKALKIAALLASADNHALPVIYSHHAQWAIDLIKRDIAIFRARVNSGDVGSGDNVRELKLLSLMKDYLRKAPADSYRIPAAMHSAGIVPRKLLQVRCANVNAFSGHRNGSVAAMDMALRSLVDSGYIVEVDKLKISAEYAFHGKCYRILNLGTDFKESD